MPILPTDFSTADLLRNGFSYRTARTLAAASEFAYSDETFIRQNLKQHGLKLVTFFDERSTHTQGFIASNDAILMICFRGTQGIRDWIQDLKIAWRDHPLGGSIHLGFDKALKSVWQDHIKAALDDPAHVNKRLYLTGHSLGGALATVCAADIAHHFEASRITAVYTFGQPLVGTRKFVKAFNALYANRFFRFRNNQDIVTCIPPKPYCHTYDRIKFNGKGKVVDGPGFGGRFESIANDSNDLGAEQVDEDILNELQFLALQRSLSETSEANSQELFGISIFSDHRLVKGYLPIIRNHADDEASHSLDAPESIGLSFSPRSSDLIPLAESIIPTGAHLSEEDLGEIIPLEEPSDGLSAHMERIVGRDNLLPASFFEQGALVQRSIARVVLTRAHRGFPPGTGFGTSFLIAPNLIMTNHHVIRSASELSAFRFQFNYQLNIQGFEEPSFSYLPASDGYLSSSEKLDYAIIRLEPGPVGNMGSAPGPAGERWGHLRLQPFVHFYSRQNFNVVQHPAGRRKEISIQDNEIVELRENVVRYTSDTEGGSSGSPVCDNFWQLVALHHAGGAQDAHGEWLNNEGIRIDRIVADLKEKHADDPALLTELGIA